MVEVRFKGNRKDYYTWSNSTPLNPGDSVLVQVDRGRDLGRVSAVGDAAQRKCAVGCASCGDGAPEPKGPVLRLASREEARVTDELRKAEEDVRRAVRERVHRHGLLMKVTDAEWQWDRKKLTIYFTADKRVDFRQLVRDLASLFRTRIELRQIGARDEAKRLTGVGRCGREYCCSSWLPELRPVSLSLAKDQQLSLNPSQISGGCGRLLCCLRYEHDFYVSSRKRFPKEGKTLTTARGHELVQAVDIFRERILLKAGDDSLRTVTLVDLKAEVASAPGGAAPVPQARPPSEPATLNQEGASLTEAPAAEAITPSRSKRRRRRRRGRRNLRRTEDNHDGQGDSAAEPPPEHRGGN